MIRPILFILLSVCGHTLSAQMLDSVAYHKALRLLEVMNVKQQYREALASGMNEDNLNMLNSGYDEKTAAAIGEFISLELSQSFDEMGPEIARLYAQTYTHEELDALLQFYDSDMGQAVADKQSIILLGSQEIVQDWSVGMMGRMFHFMDSIGVSENGSVFSSTHIDSLLQKPAQDCSAFHEGDFEIEEGGSFYNVTRKDDLQENYYPQEDYTDIYTIEWTGACEYTLTLKTDTEEPTVIRGTIYETSEGGYLFAESIEGWGLNYQGEAFILDMSKD